MKNIKMIFIILISIVLIFNIPLYSKAFSVDDIIESGNDFLNAADSQVTITPSEDGLMKLSQSISSVLLTIAIGITLISAIVMAINFIVQSVEDKAKIKESMIPWIIGIFISFGAYGIWKITMLIFYQI